jgi:hypothetical protein
MSFVFCCFSYLFLSLALNNLTIMCLSIDLFNLHCFLVVKMCKFYQVGEFGVNKISNTFCSFLFLSLSSCCYSPFFRLSFLFYLCFQYLISHLQICWFFNLSAQICSYPNWFFIYTTELCSSQISIW